MSSRRPAPTLPAKSEEQKHLRRELDEARRELTALRQQHALFIRAAAHELRTPLQPLQGLAELMEAGQPLEQLTANLETIKRETARLVAVVDDLSLRSELEADTLLVTPTSFHPEPLLEELARTMEKYYPGRLEVEYDDLPSVQADQEHVRRVLWMLLLNAMRYSPPQDLICLSVRPNQGKRQIQFLVRDTATRILPRYREMIFEPLAQMPRLLQRPRFGLGLGLYVAREIARRMGGDLWLHQPSSRKDKASRRGNVFVLSLPFAAESI
jgi:signal transduction histidine kinase